MEKRETLASKRLKKRMHKKETTLKYLAIVLLFGIVILFDLSSPVQADDDNLVYKVYLDQEYLGRIDNPNIIDNYLSQMTEKYFEEFLVSQVYTPDDFILVPELLKDSHVVNNDEVIEKFKRNAEFKVDGFVIEIARMVFDDQQDEESEGVKKVEVIKQFNVLNRSNFESALEKYIKLFINEDEYERIMNGGELPTLKEDQSLLFNFYLDGDISIYKKQLNVNDVLKSEQEIVNYLLFQNKTVSDEKEYTIEFGDNVRKISEEQHLTVDELILLNESVPSEYTVLVPGETLNITETNPIITVIREHYLVTREVIPYERKVKYDPARYTYRPGYVSQEGVNGERLVKYLITSVNGEEMRDGGEIVESQITREPQTKIVTKGSLTSSRIGTGYFKWPTISTRINAHFGYYKPFGKTIWHSGLDIGGRRNDPIYAIDNGVVEWAGYESIGGYKVIIDHNNGYKSIYAHMNSWPLVKKGNVINKGGLIGRMGKSGRVTGVHLHLAIEKWGERVNPYYLVPRW